MVSGSLYREQNGFSCIHFAKYVICVVCPINEEKEAFLVRKAGAFFPRGREHLEGIWAQPHMLIVKDQTLEHREITLNNYKPEALTPPEKDDDIVGA